MRRFAALFAILFLAVQPSLGELQIGVRWECPTNKSFPVKLD